MPDRSTLQKVAMLYGAFFLLIGILGFVPGITSNYDELDFAGNDSQAELLGIFQVSILHNLVHVLFGLAGLAVARTWEGSRAYLIGGGVFYLGLWLYGLLVDADSDANFVPMNTADDWLHLSLGVTMILFGYLLARNTPVYQRAT